MCWGHREKSGVSGIMCFVGLGPALPSQLGPGEVGRPLEPAIKRGLGVLPKGSLVGDGWGWGWGTRAWPTGPTGMSRLLLLVCYKVSTLSTKTEGMRLRPLLEEHGNRERGQLSDTLCGPGATGPWEEEIPSQEYSLRFCLGPDCRVQTSKHQRRSQVSPLFLAEGPHPLQARKQPLIEGPV